MRARQRGSFVLRYQRKKTRDRSRPPFVDVDFASALSRRSRNTDETGRNAHGDHRTQALCRQVQRVLSLALAGECDDDVLRDAYVAEVIPAPGPKRLGVRIVIGQDVSIADFLERVDRVRPKLRAIVAQTITRKKVPELFFLPAGPEEIDHD